eukprot:1705757-Rhodomonas_salina.1
MMAVIVAEKPQLLELWLVCEGCEWEGRQLEGRGGGQDGDGEVMGRWGRVGMICVRGEEGCGVG